MLVGLAGGDEALDVGELDVEGDVVVVAEVLGEVGRVLEVAEVLLGVVRFGFGVQDRLCLG